MKFFFIITLSQNEEPQSYPDRYNQRHAQAQHGERNPRGPVQNRVQLRPSKTGITSPVVAFFDLAPNVAADGSSRRPSLVAAEVARRDTPRPGHHRDSARRR